MKSDFLTGRTVTFKNQPRIIATSSVSGPKECTGIIGEYVETALNDDTFGESTFEKAECKMLSTVIDGVIKNANLKREEVDVLFSGDLLNQIIWASCAARDFDIPFLGVYSACSTMSESMFLAASMVNAGYCHRAIAATGSHFASAERQYRYPLEQGTTRPPQSQWTVTGAGACMIADEGDGVKIVNGTMGKVVDFGVTDVNNMGAAMAPACADTLIRHFRDTQTTPDDYDMIVSGDLGVLGSRLLKDLTWEKGFDISAQHVDCGEIIYKVVEDEFQGGSGAG